MTEKLQKDESNTILLRLTRALAKIAEIAHWVLAGVMLIGAIAAIVQPTSVANWLKSSILGNETSLSCYGFEVALTSGENVPSLGMILVFTLGSMVVLSLMAMIFRNVYLILKTAQGKTWFAQGGTPFQANIVRMFREIGIFFIAIAVMTLGSEILVNFTGGELSQGFNYLDAFIGLVFICVSQFFSYGASLEKDLDGLV